MLMEKIESLKEKLDELVLNKASYEEIYEVSVELDKYIVQYYKDMQ